jgi:alkyl sulfatase BDS1-like metallo-beta-lactamase superfamily hydrolase
MADDDANAPKGATPETCHHNTSLLDALPFGDTQDFADAARGHIATF